MSFDKPQMVLDLKAEFEDLSPTKTAEDAANGVADAIVDNYTEDAEDWTTVSSFDNGWQNSGGSFDDAGYYKDPSGRVYLRGLIKNGTVDSTAFTLPSGYRPGATKVLSTISANSVGRVDVNASGEVIPHTPSSNVWVSLDNLSFRAA